MTEKNLMNQENDNVIKKIESIVNLKKGKYLSIDQYNEIKKLIFNNESDILSLKPEDIPKDLLEVIEDYELYYGFTENEIKSFLKAVTLLGYTFNYIDVATRDNGEMNHTFRPYALRKINN